ncbi:hypothetical protein LTR53_010870 [Teratosphaeriaceae sp. CCFEE 6253]|nr:hypothetical protein LTR53_010870 [Teratosphaeriaceae sp. CCFEE 6253]
MYTVWNNGSRAGDESPVAGMIASINSGFAQPFITGTSSSPAELMNGAFNCGSTNCSMGLYSTLSVCSKCADTSHLINTHDGIATLPDRSLSLAASALLNVTSDTEYPKSDVLGQADIGPLIVHYRALARGYDNVAPAAVECVAYWCVSTINGNITSNVLEEEVLNTNTNLDLSDRTSYARGSDIVIALPQCWYNNNLYDRSSTCTSIVAASAQRAIQNFLTFGLFGSPPFLSGSRSRRGNSDQWYATSYAAQMLGDPCTYASKNVSQCNTNLYAGLTAAFTNMTAFMSQAVRTGNSGRHPYTFGNATTTTYRFDISIEMGLAGLSDLDAASGMLVRYWDRDGKPWREAMERVDSAGSLPWHS